MILNFNKNGLIGDVDIYSMFIQRKLSEERIICKKKITFGPMCKKIQIGFGSYIGNDVYIDVPELIIGDYTLIHNHTIIHGYKNCYIGHNCFVAAHTLIDSIGGVVIGNNVGMSGKYYSHIKYGDVLAGSRFNKDNPLIIDDDVWFCGWCLCSPIHAESKSMALMGSVITKDMKSNHIYAGNPAIDITDKIGGGQFKEKSLSEKKIEFLHHYVSFLKSNNLDIKDFEAIVVDDLSGVNSNDKITYFNVDGRRYKPSRSKLEYMFIKYLLPEKGKFCPII